MDLLKEIWNQNRSVATLSKFDYQYDVLGRIKQWTEQADANTPQVMSMDYDNEDQLLDAAIAPQGQSTTRTFNYGYDVAGNRTSEEIYTSGINLTATTSAYNSVNELANRSGAGPFPVRFRGKINEPATATVNGQTAKMTQDPNSASNGKIFTSALNLPTGNNNVAVVATDFASPTAHVTTSNYVVNVAGGPGKTFAYDANGNLTNVVTATTTNNYAWDAENQLVKITLLTNNTQLTSEFTYDGFGRRVQIVEKADGTVTSTKVFVWVGKQLCEERDQYNNVTKRFIAEGEQINGAKYFYTKDHLGSIREMTGPQGMIRARYDYDPYGRRTKVSGDQEADFGFTGYYVHQPSGLQLALYRAYDADIGRWPNRDPIEEEGGINLYAYVGNDPVNWIDPFGLYYAEMYAGVGVGIGAGAVALASIPVDAATGGANILATVPEMAIGGAIGGYVGYAIGWWGDTVCQMSKRPARNKDRDGHRGGNDSDTHGNAQGHGGREGKPNFTRAPQRPSNPPPSTPPPKNPMEPPRVP